MMSVFGYREQSPAVTFRIMSPVYGGCADASVADQVVNQSGSEVALSNHEPRLLAGSNAGATE